MSKNNDPYVLQLLRSFCPRQLVEEIEGDLLQKFNRDLQSPDRLKWSGDSQLFRAKRRLFWNVIRFFRPRILLRNNFCLNLFDMSMIRKNITLAFRHMRKDWTFSAINIFGLSISMAACFLIFQYALFELSYDKQYRNCE